MPTSSLCEIAAFGVKAKGYASNAADFAQSEEVVKQHSLQVPLVVSEKPLPLNLPGKAIM